AHIQHNPCWRRVEDARKAGYCEEWTYHSSLSRSHQGGIVSPILSNIYMDRFDKFVHDTLIPEYTRGRRRQLSHTYRALQRRAQYYRQTGNLERANALRKQCQQQPSVDPHDVEYRRLRHVRYADHFTLGYAGTRAEATAIKEKVATFLDRQLHLTLSADKTLITQASTGPAPFLEYELGTMSHQMK